MSAYGGSVVLLTITTTHRPATDLGHLLHKHPERVHTFEMGFGKAYVFYPEASAERCTAALLLDVDPVGLVRGRPGSTGEGALEQYVNDRPYVASSFMSVALREVYSTAMTGRSKDRPELAATALPFEVTLAVLPVRGGEGVLKRLFEPLGYQVGAERRTLDVRFPEWGESSYYSVTLSATCLLRDLLAHLYVLVPVLDADKHYWVGDDEVEKLLRHGKGWLAAHPERELITVRYLKRKHSLIRDALARLADEDVADPDEVAETHEVEEERLEERVGLGTQRMGAVMAALRQSGAKRVLDLGCGEGRLLKALLDDKSFTQITGMDVSHRVLERAADRLRLDRMPERQKGRLTLLHGSLTYRDARLAGYDAAAVVEVIEHLDPPRLTAFERVLFEYAQPGTVVMTTPNAEYNATWESLPAGRFRHKDHRFEWSRAEFETWATRAAERFGYAVRFLPVGPEDPALGAPTQMAVFSRNDGT
jgi:3' terminal RNA ribose 2'-O-methyltransferase Hen1